MTDLWVPSPPLPSPPWVDPVPPSNEWSDTPACVDESGPSIVNGIIIRNIPAVILAPNAWGITLNDGDSPPNFTIDHYDGTGTYIDSPMEMSGVDGSIQFNHPVLLSRDPVQPMEAVTLEYLETHSVGIPEPPDNQTYGRALGVWNLVVPQSGGTFTGPTNLSAGGAVTGGALLFAGSAVCSIPTVAQLTIGGGSLGQVPATDGNGNLSWITPVTGGPYLPIAGGTVTGSLTVNQVLTVQGSNSFVLNAPVTGGSQRTILGMASNVARWGLTLGDGTAEGLNNTGANFSLTAYSTTGAFLGNWLTIARADGSAVFNGTGVTINGGLAVNGLLAVNSIGNFYLPGGTAGQFLSTNGSGLLSWATPAGGGGGISDAPNDGTAYARKSAAWVHLTHTDITDWTATLAPYALTSAVPIASNTTPIMDGTAAPGTAATFSRGDHVHPTDTSRYAASNPSGYQTAAQVTTALGGYLPLTGGALTGNLSFVSANPSVVLQKSASGGVGQIYGYTGANARWLIALGDTAAESGGNVGSNFSISRYSDAGAFVSTPLIINRASGAASFSGNLILNSFQSTNAVLGGFSNAPNITYTSSGLIVEHNTAPLLFLNRSQVGVGIALANFYQNSSALTGSISVANQSSTQFNTSSDGRLKEDRRPIESGPLLDALEVWDFRWKAPVATRDGGEVRGQGVIAQDAIEVFPNAIHHDEDSDAWGADYSKFVPMLIAEVQALRARVAALEAAR